ncbi:MAG: hypothetical protein GYB65_19665 [Chloroflexi bacterium]|nr:hypothetical protein [Chloroflexota bacterium]
MSLNVTNGRRDLALAFVAFVVAFALWQVAALSFMMYPFRLFVTIIHELGHGLSALLTGGEFVEFEVSKNGAGLAKTRPGARFIIIQAGYLGTAIFGALLLFATNRTKRPGMVAIVVGMFIAILTLLFSGISVSQLGLFETVIVVALIIVSLFLILTRETDEGRYVGLGVGALAGAGLLLFAGGNQDNTLLTVVTGVSSGVALILLGYFATREAVVVTLNFLAFLTGLQAITDAWVLLKIVSLPESLIPNNDASSMAREFWGPAGMWAMIWIMLDVLIFGAAVYFTFIHPMRQQAIGTGSAAEEAKTAEPESVPG